VRAVISGIGHYLPPDEVRNEDLPVSLNTNSDWIVKRTGIRSRRYVTGRVYTSDLATLAAKAAIADAAIDASSIDCIIAATLSPDYFFPGIGVYVQAKLGIPSIPAYDIRNQCSGFLYSLEMARAFVVAGVYRTVLVVCAEIHSHGLGQTEPHRHVTPLFGDGAAAVIVSAPECAVGPRFDVDYVRVYADGTGADALRFRLFDMSVSPILDWQQVCSSPDEMQFPEMDGQRVFRAAVVGMTKAAQEALDALGLTIDDVAWCLPHQANINIVHSVSLALKLPEERLRNNIDRVGNTTAASIPLLLSECVEARTFKPADRILLVAFGSGFTWGAAVLRAR